MPANDFEKKVQQRIDELKLTPSPEVWQEVEYRIRKEKKKRRVLFWLPFLFLVLSGGIVTIVLTGKKKSMVIAKANEKKSDNNNSSFQNKIGTANLTDDKNSNAQRDNNNQKNLDKPRTKIFSIDDNKSFVLKNNESIKDKSTTVTLKEKKSSGKIWNGAAPAGQKKDDTDVGNSLTTEMKPEPLSTPNINSVEPKKDEATKINSNEVAMSKDNKQDQPIEAKKDSTEVTTLNKQVIKSARKNKTSNWQWGIMFGAGRSNIGKGIQFKDKSLYNMSATPGTSTGAQSYPSDIRESGSFEAGVFTQKFLSKRFDISFGLNYSYLSTKMDIGNRVDSSFTFSAPSSSLALDNFYRASSGSSHPYTNHYLFMGLSTELSWKFIKGRKFSLSWDNGLRYERLLSSNALHFSGNIPGYYKDFGLLNHDHIFVSTGLSIPFLKQFSLNPFAEYSISAVIKNSAPKTHFTEYGMKAKFFLGKQR